MCHNDIWRAINNTEQSIPNKALKIKTSEATNIGFKGGFTSAIAENSVLSKSSHTTRKPLRRENTARYQWILIPPKGINFYNMT